MISLSYERLPVALRCSTVCLARYSSTQGLLTLVRDLQLRHSDRLSPGGYLSQAGHIVTSKMHLSLVPASPAF